MYDWPSFTFAPGETRRLRFGNLHLWIHRQEKAWLYGSVIDEADIPGEEKPETVNWNRVVTVNTTASIRIVPVMPDRPVVVRTQFPLTIKPRGSTQFYADLPVWIRGETASRPAESIFELACGTMSNTWYGGPLTGKLCYTLDAALHYDFDKVPLADTVACCRLFISNRSKKSFSVGKIPIFANLLAVYRLRGHGPDLWTQGARATLSGEDELSVDVDDKVPVPGAELVTTAREKTDENILRKSLILLRKITNY